MVVTIHPFPHIGLIRLYPGENINHDRLQEPEDYSDYRDDDRFHFIVLSK
jgi:hypothetical protein